MGTATCPVVHFDHQAPTTEHELRLTYRGLLDEPTAVRSDAHGGFWLVSGYDQVRAAALDHQHFSSAQGVFFPDVPGRPFGIAIEMDPPVHIGYRRLYAEWVSSGRLRDYEPMIRELTVEHVRRFVDDGGGDFVREVSAKLPIQVIARAIGLDAEVALAFFEVSDRMARGETAAIRELFALCAREIGARRAEPRDDFLTYALAARIDDEPMTDQTLVSWLAGAVFAGHDTTLLSGAALVKDLALDPALQDALRRRPELAPAAVDESLRLNSPVQRFFRVVTEDVDFAGVHMSAGDRVLLIFAAANLDARRFPEPERFDLERAYTRHLTFGWGVHRCVGAPLAQLELAILAETMVQFCTFGLAREPELGRPTALGNFVGYDELLIDVEPLSST